MDRKQELAPTRGGVEGLKEYTERLYRKRVRSSGLVTFEVAVKETDLQVSAEKDLEKETRDLVFSCRHQIESYINTHPDFLTTLTPYPDDPLAPPLVREMIERTKYLGVGPMASVAGAIAQYVGTGLLQWTREVIVENGGDIFLKANRAITVSIFAGKSPLSNKLGLVVSPSQMPVGVCTSSGTVGHSYSMGVADAACILSPSAALADGAATAMCNRIQSKEDLDHIGEWTGRMRGVTGALVILGDKMATWGEIELVAL
jgi:ApbE superfamily uncharacterized protein (UPF0280 family)